MGKKSLVVRLLPLGLFFFSLLIPPTSSSSTSASKSISPSTNLREREKLGAFYLVLSFSHTLLSLSLSRQPPTDFEMESIEEEKEEERGGRGIGDVVVCCCQLLIFSLFSFRSYCTSKLVSLLVEISVSRLVGGGSSTESKEKTSLLMRDKSDGRRALPHKHKTHCADPSLSVFRQSRYAAFLSSSITTDETNQY